MITGIKLCDMKGTGVKDGINELSVSDKRRLVEWYGKESADDALELYLWCKGQAAVCFGEDEESDVFSEKASSLGITVDELYEYYSSADGLDNAQERLLMPADEKKGRFIVLEGLDGAGKTTNMQRLASSLTAMGRRVYVTAEPTCTAVGGVIRETLSGTGKRGAEEMAALFLADRINHNMNPNNGIQQFLNKGIDVICDRYYYSSLAYQGIDSDLDWLIACNTTCPAILKPDICIFLDLQPEICARRISRTRLTTDIFETEETIRRIRQRFADVFSRLSDNENIVAVTTDKPSDVIAETILKAVKNLF